MATYTITGFRLTSNTNGSYNFLGGTDLIIQANDGYGFEYEYLDPADPDIDVNDFGIPEIEFTDNGPYSSNFPNNENNSATVFSLNSTQGDTTHVLTLFNAVTEETHIYFIGGSMTELPTSQSELNQLLSSVASATQLTPELQKLETLANTTVNDNDVFFETSAPPTTGRGASYSFGDGDDAIYLFEGKYTVNGATGNDRIVANGGTSVVLYGGDGNDIMKFKGGTDGTMLGGNGDDMLVGDLNTDYLAGEIGSDILLGLAGDDFLYGYLIEDDPFPDPLTPEEIGGDFLYGGRGNDYLKGDIADDVLRGNRDQDTLDGGAGIDRLYGGGGNDDLDGGDGNDFMLGENGNDTFQSSAGNDRMTGAAGADTFIMELGMGFDTILDFEVGVDVIDLSAISGFDTFSDVSDVASDRSSGVRLDLANDTTLLLAGVTEAQLTADDFIL